MRIELPVSGGWWEIREWLSRGARKRIRQRALRAMFTHSQKFTQAELAGKQAQIEVDLAAVDDSITDDGYLLEGTVAWSFAHPVDLDYIDNELHPNDVEVVLRVMRQQYREQTEEETRNLGTL